jgi:glycosyltransferase involved in cell wall biosynthesis
VRVCLETTALRAQLTGVGHYVRGLADALLEHYPDITLQSFDGFRFERLAETLKAHSAALEQNKSLLSEAKLYQATRQVKVLRTALRHVKAWRFKAAEPVVDVFHALNFMPPGESRTPAIPVIYDASHVRYSETHPKERIDWLNARLKTLHRHPIINTISEFSADEIADIYNVPRADIRVTTPGIDAIYLRPPQPVDTITVNGKDLRHKAYALIVGTLEPRKNHAVVLSAYKALAPALRKAFPLVVVGQYGWGENAADHAKELIAEGSLILTNYVSKADLAALYANARVFLFPSLYEGFGLPVVEAMASGTPVIASDIAVFHEVGGTHITYASTKKVDDWVHQLSTVLGSDPASKVTNNAVAREAALQHTWQQNAAKTRDIYLERLAIG